MRRKQNGMTILGFLMAAVVAVLIIFAALRLVPVYLEHMKIVSVLESVKGEYGGSSPNVRDLRISIEKRLDVEDVHVVRSADFKITNIGGGYRIEVEYDHVVPYIANVSLLAHFENAVEVTN